MLTTFFDYRISMIIVVAIILYEMRTIVKGRSYNIYGIIIRISYFIMALMAIILQFSGLFIGHNLFQIVEIIALSLTLFPLLTLILKSTLNVIHNSTVSQDERVLKAQNRILWKIPLLGTVIFYTVWHQYGMTYLLLVHWILYILMTVFIIKLGKIRSLITDYIAFIIFISLGNFLLFLPFEIGKVNYSSIARSILWSVALVFLFKAIYELETCYDKKENS